MTGQELLIETERFWKPSLSGAGPVRRVPSYYDSELPLQRFPIDTDCLMWMPGKDTMEHAALTIWMHPRRPGGLHTSQTLAATVNA